MISNGIRHIVWDWNGTLLDDVAASVEAMNRMLARRGLGRLTVERYRDIFEFPVKGYYRRLGFDLEGEDWNAVAEEFHAHYAETSRDAPLRAGIAGTLDRLRERRVPMSVLSASETSILRRMMEGRGIAHYFERICGLADLHARSKLELGRQLLSNAALSPQHVLLVGDTTHDYEVARELNWRCVLIAGGHQSESRLAECRCEHLRSPDEVVRLALGPPEG